MLVKDLIEALQALPPELEVYISSDDEGNSFRKLGYSPSESFARTYPSNNDYYADVYCDEDVKDMDEEDKKDLRKIVVL